MTINAIIKKLVKKKVQTEEDIRTTELKRCLTTFDLTLLGIGCTLGAGLYVLTGQVAHDTAGPSIIISFLVAAIASMFAGLCYAEFAARIPRAGSAYVYSYTTIGELMAFTIGWNLVLEYIIGTASVARGWSGYFDSLLGYKISHSFQDAMPIGISSLSAYPDFLAFGLTMVMTVVIAFGVKESSRLNNVFCGINLLVVVYITICGLFQVDWHNWNLTEDEVPASAGTGGFMPFGFSGMMSGAASCFYAFVGFDVVATTGEETKNPQRSIPIAILASLTFCFIPYFAVSAVVTLMCPYFLLDTNAPLPAVFSRVGWGVAKYVISAGALCGLSTSLLCGMFPLPRVLYAMGSDKVIFSFFAKVSPRFQTPLIGTIISGIMAGLMAMLFDLGELVDMMSIGTLLAYTLVAIAVLILRYETNENQTGALIHPDDNKDIEVMNEQEIQPILDHPVSIRLSNLFVSDSLTPTALTARIVKIAIALMSLFIILFSAFIVLADSYLVNKDIWAIVVASILGILMLMTVIVIQRQPQTKATLPFKVPLLPFLPALSTLINIYLMCKLSVMTWIRFGVWMVIGIVIYTYCSVYYSRQEANEEQTRNPESAPTSKRGRPTITIQ